ncbi:MAG: DUF1552 domain-containing protein [Myxococcales bacterium]|nr:DUF1552 domain-containing protein [Myxococcales bacterium]
MAKAPLSQLSLSPSSLSRRTLLRGVLAGASVSIGLPLLEIMLDQHGEALADGEPLPVRFVSWFFGNGVKLSRFVPAAEGPGYPLSDELKPFASVSDYVSVLTGFNNHCAANNKITHHEGMVIFNGFNNRDVGAGQGFFSNAGGPTIDQVIANLPSVSAKTPIKSTQIGISKRPSQVDFGTTMHALSHAGYLMPLPPEYSPQAIYKTLFDSFSPPEDPMKPHRIAALDIVRENAKKLALRLGALDKQRLEAHLGNVAELEKKILALPPPCTKPDAPLTTNVDVDGKEPLVAVNDAMSELLVYAFKCDITRVASVLFAEGAGNTIYADLGLPGAHHDYTHDGNDATQNGAVHDGVVYTMQRLAYLCERLKNEPDGVDGNMLDNTIVFASSDCAEGISHSVDMQPMIVVGRGGGKLVPGTHFASKTGENPTDVLVTILQCFDPAATSVGKDEPGSNKAFAPLKLV